MQKVFDYWLPRYYPRFNHEKFTMLLRDVRQRQLPIEEFQYVVLGCGYLYRVHPPDAEASIGRIKREIAAQYGHIAAEALVDESRTRKIRELAKGQGLLIGPLNRPLSDRRKPGQLPDPAPKIASLVIAAWVAKRRPQLEPAPWGCDLYTALSRRNLSPESFGRYQNIAAKEKVSAWVGAEEKQVTAIDHLLTFLDNRYRRLQQEGFPIQEAEKNPGILYPIDFLEPVLRAIDLEIERTKTAAVASIFE